jgi:ribosomal protein L27
MIGVGGVTHKHYPETKGLKITGGQQVKKGAVLTREGDKWKAGLNVGGKNTTLYALCDGTVYFSTKRGTYRTKKRYTYINIKAKA